jgi:hypothetical protein
MVVLWRATRYEKTPEGNLAMNITGEVELVTGEEYKASQINHT